MRATQALFVCLLAGPLALAVEDQAAIQKMFAISPGDAAKLEIDNVNGAIRVTGYDGREVQVQVRQRIEADSQEKLEEARRDVKLDMTQQAGLVRLYVDGPFRCNCKCGEGQVNYRGRRHDGYEVRYDFEIRAPRQTALTLHAVNHGEIHVEGIEGDYKIETINGHVEMKDAAGSGRVYALNGGVNVTFRKNPRAASNFGSLNGPVDLYFQPDLAANLRMKTFNGKVYSDFEVLPAASAAAVETEERHGRRVFRTNRFTTARIGAGGPEITLDGFNGDMRILKRQ